MKVPLNQEKNYTQSTKNVFQLNYESIISLTLLNGKTKARNWSDNFSEENFLSLIKLYTSICDCNKFARSNYLRSQEKIEGLNFVYKCAETRQRQKHINIDSVEYYVEIT